jgi:hypothetical protein
MIHAKAPSRKESDLAIAACNAGLSSKKSEIRNPNGEFLAPIPSLRLSAFA